jgi:hypothetical protein
LEALANNGGPTRTHALKAGSPALNAGDATFDPAAFTPPLVHDQRGESFTRVAGGRIDLGAFEVQSASAPSGDFDGDGDRDGNDFLIWQRGVGLTGAAATRAKGNADNDGDVDGADLGVWRSQYGSGLVAALEAEQAVAVVAAKSGGSARKRAEVGDPLQAELVDAAMAYQAAASADGSWRPWRGRRGR